MTQPAFEIRQLKQQDFFWLKDFDCSPLAIERDSIYLFFCVHFQQYCFVAEDNTGCPMGFVLGFLPAGSSNAYVHYLFVKEGLRRQGIGAALMESFCNVAISNGGKRAFLYTVRASKFYRTLNFSESTDFFESPIGSYILQVKGALPMVREL